MTTSGQMPIPTCAELHGQLPDWADGRLPEEAEAPFFRHLELCAPCGAYARTYQALAHVAREALAVKMPEAAAARLRKVLLERMARPGGLPGADPGP